MSRLSTMSRFAEPDEKEPTVYSNCYSCGADLVEGQDIEAVHQYHYCDMDCLDRDTETITLGDE